MRYLYDPSDDLEFLVGNSVFVSVLLLVAEVHMYVLLLPFHHETAVPPNRLLS